MNWQIKKSIHSRRPRRGFSLVELLVSISIIGILGALAVPSISNTSDNTRMARAKAMAQDIAAVFNSGRVAGAFSSATDVATAMNAVGMGANGTGALGASRFEIAGVSSGMYGTLPEKQRPSYYLKWEGGLVFDERGGASAGPSPFQGSYQDWYNQAFSTWAANGATSQANTSPAMVAFLQANMPNPSWNLSAANRRDVNSIYIQAGLQAPLP